MNRFDEPVFIAVAKPLLTEFDIHLRSEICVFTFDNLLAADCELLVLESVDVADDWSP